MFTKISCICFILNKLFAYFPGADSNSTPYSCFLGCVICYVQFARQVLILAPTRELANQVHEDFAFLEPGIKVVCVFGGTSYEKQGELDSLIKK